jgi:DNA-binding NtrC family response regulator
MLMSLLLIPLALTVAINNHQVFGIRGLARRRVLHLERQLERERGAIERRDDRIASLVAEIDWLKAELRQRDQDALGAARPTTQPERLRQLCEDYPEISAARATSLLGASPLWVGVFESMVLASRGWTPVLIVGESGTGKTAVADTIAKLTATTRSVYREVSCAQFEHADPAFALGRLFGIGVGHGLPNTPAAGRVGLFEECDGGCLFLDDFDRLPLNVQNVLLYPLEGKPFEPGIGSGPPRRVRIKFLLATNRDPDELVASRALQADVLARIGAQVRVPPLRDRPEDIPLLIEDFLERTGHEFGHAPADLSPAALARLQSHDYRRGNVRELHAEVRHALGHAELDGANVVHVDHLSDHLNPRKAETTANAGDPGRSPRPPDESRALAVLRRHEFQIRASEVELGLSHRSKTLSNHLRGMCIRALVQADWDLDVAARDLAGPSSDAATERVRRKLRRYANAIAERVAERTSGRLYNNLPRQYHADLQRAIARFERGDPRTGS